MTRLFIFGIDGVPFHIMEKYANDGVMPHFASLREKSGQQEKIKVLEDDILDFTGAIPDLESSNDYF